MIQSMTGYGRGEHSSERYQFGIEIRGTNHRFLEIKLRFPRELNAFENEARAYIRKRFSRGYLDVHVFLGRASTKDRRFVVDQDLLSQAAAALSEAGKALGTEEKPDLAVLAQFREIFSFEEEPDDLEELKGGLMKAVAGAVESLGESRSREGEEIVKSLRPIMDRFGEQLLRMEALAPETTKKLAVGLRTRLDELAAQTDLSVERLHQESAFLAMKADVTEELERLKGHEKVFMETLSGKGPKGRKLDFLLQEMNRELNTTASKAGTLELAHLAIEGKLEMEKVREQVQNLE